MLTIKEFILSHNKRSLDGIMGLKRHDAVLNENVKKVEGFAYPKTKFKSVNFITSESGNKITYIVIRKNGKDYKYVTDRIQKEA